MIWCNGNFLDDGSGLVDLTDRGVLHGLGAFETMLAEDGVVLHESRHRMRLQEAVRRLGLLDLAQVDLHHIVVKLCEHNHCAQGKARVRVTLTAGRGEMDALTGCEDGKVFVQVQSYVPPVDRPHLITLPWRRNEQSPLVGLKCASYAENLLALRHARAQGADEGLFFNTRDELCEACMANVFLKIEGELFTPPLASGCLPGVMRAVILDLAREQGIVIHEAVIGRSQLAMAEQIFLSSALRGIVPAQSLDQRLLAGAAFPVMLP